jgi:hypothetical protein
MQDKPISAREINIAIARKYGCSPSRSLESNVNFAIRTLPGGNELLDAIETTNAARNHSSKARADDRVIALDASIDKLEAIRAAMKSHIIQNLDLHKDTPP